MTIAVAATSQRERSDDEPAPPEPGAAGDLGAKGLGYRDRRCEAVDHVAEGEGQCVERAETQRTDVGASHRLVPALDEVVFLGEERLVDHACLEYAEGGGEQQQGRPATSGSAHGFPSEQRGAAVKPGEEDDGEHHPGQPAGRVTVRSQQFGADGAQEQHGDDRNERRTCLSHAPTHPGLLVGWGDRAHRGQGRP